MKKRLRSSFGTSMLEVMAGSLVLIPVLLLAVDAAYVMVASKSNQELADTAARVAANKTTQDDATKAATTVIAAFHKTDNMQSVRVGQFTYNPTAKLVSILVVMDIKMPVPLPGLGMTTLKAESIHPIVGIPPQR